MRKEINCCKICDAKTWDKDEYPPKFVEACIKPSCICHKNTAWHPKGRECENNCGYQEPYGFVPESGCLIHDFSKVIAGIDFSDCFEKLSNLSIVKTTPMKNNKTNEK